MRSGLKLSCMCKHANHQNCPLCTEILYLQDMKSLLGQKYGSLSVSELKENKDFLQDVLDEDLCMTVRLQIVYGRLSIRSVRSAFEESVGSRLQKFSGSDNKELLQSLEVLYYPWCLNFKLQPKDIGMPSDFHLDAISVMGLLVHRFTSQFKDEYKIPRGSIIDLSKERDHVLSTKIDGKEVGIIQSKLLCRSILDLYVGDDPFDRHAKEGIELGLASLLQKGEGGVVDGGAGSGQLKDRLHQLTSFLPPCFNNTANLKPINCHTSTPI
ncbi:hypothetical protein ACLOJK_028820 [Asimina triloba]